MVRRLEDDSIVCEAAVAAVGIIQRHRRTNSSSRDEMALFASQALAENDDFSSRDWDTALYLKFEAERTQPARDLLARVRPAARRIVDLGCGPGTSTQLLAARFPSADILGIDSSARMLVAARARLPGIKFEQCDIGDWSPREKPDVIFANAALQWLPNHHQLIPRLMSFLSDDGCLAIQMPDNRQEPSHALMRMVAADGPWADRLVPVAKTRGLIGIYSDYYGWLRPLAEQIEIWQTTYVHPLPGVGAVVDWFRGSGLRPFLNLLDECEREQFIARYMEGLADAYPTEPDGRLLFLYPRLFVIASKRAARD
jgi:trans-aconitate 2-methyltransferase